MAPAFDTQPVPDVLFRVGRKPDAWKWPDREYIGGGRYDSPDKSYRVLYAGTSAFGAYMEKLSALQPSLEVMAELKQIRSNAAGLRRTQTTPTLSPAWRRKHLLCWGKPDGVRAPFVAVGRARTLSTLRKELAGAALEMGIKDIDSGVIRLDYSDEYRRFTQAISGFIYRKVDGAGTPFSGIYYLGQHGDEIENYAVFERCPECPVTPAGASDIALDDPHFLRACTLLRVKPA